MPSPQADALFKNVCDYYEITEFRQQILEYHETYGSSFIDKIMPPEELELSLREGFYIGHYKTGLGEFLSYTPVPRYLKRFFPQAKVYVCGHRFAEALFRHNPHVDGVVDWEHRKSFGDFREFGFGTQAQKRLRAFGIFTTEPVGPEIHVSQPVLEKWQEWRAKLPLAGRKLVMIQSSGRTNPKVFSFFKWWSYLTRLRDEFYFVQIGNLRDQFIWPVKVMLGQYDMEDMTGLLKQGDCFIGPNSGVMHLASAANVPSVILHNEAKSSEMVLPLLGDNWFLPHQVNHHLHHVYPWHHHLVIDAWWDEKNPPGPFAERANLENLRSSLRKACLGSNPTWELIKDRFVSEPVSVHGKS